MSVRRSSLAVPIVALLAFGSAAAQELAVARLEEAPPSDLAEPVRATLAPGAVRVTIDDSVLDFWWARRLEAATPDWSAVREGALIGAMRTASALRDIRGRTIKAGTYTLRYGIQPENGDHLGVSPHREFLLVCPAARDAAPQAAGHEGAVDLSKATIGGSHPAVLSLDPPIAVEPVLAVRSNDAGHKGVVFEVPTSGGPLRFGLILVGRIEA